MRHTPKIQNIVRTLIKSRFYFDLPLRERLDFIKDMLRRFPASLPGRVSFVEKTFSLEAKDIE